MLPFRIVSIHGAPRSGTSWLGQIFNSHPDVAFRFQPLFSYRFKGAINPESSKAETERFFHELYAVDSDEFILQTKQRSRGVHPTGMIKLPRPSHLVMKEVRYHYVIETLLSQIEGIKIIGIVRNPCGAINSWLKTPREFNPAWDMWSEWRVAQSKNQGRLEEFFGFDKWMELASLFLYLSQESPEAFHLVRYEDLVSSPLSVTERLFSFCGLELPCQTASFLASSQTTEVDDPDTVFRTPDVAERWENELSPDIRDAILCEIRGTELEVFL
ncbi:sulfotransferase [Propionivibrio sp.]|uniref:sulfotransferase family protein n=1 Tax=Propionivibrio sp. TaxID=2212460 RepID=UPI0025E7F609|nr:sulfotransferase [Propionivibrio sp.]MBK7357392.1 sulfotransferase [Propionivibrio sp.]MBK8743239.1 sulfotransferase [Propionivibrio sp.]MBK8894746.1 sulfotransferase [Propionivibrio sp.]